ncbi:MAG: flagellar basal body rod protein FlgB [Oceanospirillaceae bacterium]|nr:flagellar basal body rod protein FlgB [Oceanospirillaceae bacterium]MBT10935.1 flagellar basal body rod protein FlgB [Oceanospirillaceae bacterium]|tara:strand:- start:95108 stop:95506 length:399 start_codon:yes stop_codon:yes gene_type:complete
MAAINFTNALGVHDSALQLRAARAEILANNLANSDTPGYKARDINFQAVLAGETAAHSSLGMNRTQKGHLEGKREVDEDLLYRNPSQPSIDGNTVDSQIEQALFTRNTLNYNTSFEFLSSKFKGMKGAIRGE